VVKATPAEVRRAGGEGGGLLTLDHMNAVHTTCMRSGEPCVAACQIPMWLPRQCVDSCLLALCVRCCCCPGWLQAITEHGLYQRTADSIPEDAWGQGMVTLVGDAAHTAYVDGTGLALSLGEAEGAACGCCPCWRVVVCVVLATVQCVCTAACCAASDKCVALVQCREV
jgi:hypothetical protein